MLLVHIKLPLTVPVSKKKHFILNFNNYKTTHYRVLNDAKKNYKALIWDSLPNMKIEVPVRFVYILYPESKRTVDVNNPVSVIDKFTSDAVVDKGILRDDNINYLKSTMADYGEVDKHDPRCDLFIFTADDPVFKAIREKCVVVK